MTKIASACPWRDLRASKRKVLSGPQYGGALKARAGTAQLLKSSQCIRLHHTSVSIRTSASVNRLRLSHCLAKSMSDSEPTEDL
jgi:hypothetical protein